MCRAGPRLDASCRPVSRSLAKRKKGRGETVEGSYPIKSFHAEAAPGELMRGVPSEVEREFVYLGGCMGVQQGRNEMAALVVVFRFDAAEAARALSRPPAMLPIRAGVVEAGGLVWLKPAGLLDGDDASLS